MIQRDYILRLLDKLVRLLVQVLGLRKAERLVEARACLAEGFKELTGLSISLAESMAVEDLVGMLGTAGEPDPGKCVAAARLFEEQAWVSEAEDNDEQAADLRLTAVELYVYAGTLPGKDHLGIVKERLPGLARLIGREGLAPELEARIARWL